MPIYEYRCHRCGKKTSKLHRSFSQQAQVFCGHCDSPEVKRLISRVTVFRSWGDSLDDMSFLDNVDESDPRAMALAMKRMQREMGEEAGPEFQETIDMLESGVMPEGMDEGMGGDPDDYDDF